MPRHTLPAAARSASRRRLGREAPALAAALACGLFAAPAMAQDAADASSDGWKFALTPYAWFPGLKTSVDTKSGTVNVDSSSSDALADLDMAFMGAFEARKGRWGLLLDLIYSDLSASQSTPFGVLWDKANVDTRMTAFSVYAGYRVIENDKGWLDVLLGGRFYSLDVDTALKPGLARGRNYDLSDDWADPLIGLRGRYAFNDTWFATASGDAGGFGGGSDESWQAIATVGYQIDPRWSIQGGWRYMAVEKKISGRDVEVDLSGPILGFTARF